MSSIICIKTHKGLSRTSLPGQSKDIRQFNMIMHMEEAYSRSKSKSACETICRFFFGGRLWRLWTTPWDEI